MSTWTSPARETSYINMETDGVLSDFVDERGKVQTPPFSGILDLGHAGLGIGHGKISPEAQVFGEIGEELHRQR